MSMCKKLMQKAELHAVVKKKIDYIKYRVIQNDCRGMNNLSCTIHLR